MNPLTKVDESFGPVNRQRYGWLRLVVAAAVALLALQTVVRGAGVALPREEKPVDEVTRVLLAIQHEEAEPDAAAKRLAALDAESLAQMFAILRAERYTVRIDDLGTTSKVLLPSQRRGTPTSTH